MGDATTHMEYKCEVREVFSGDDLIAYIDLGVENLLKRQRIRLHGVDTPSAINMPRDSEAGKLREYIRSLCRGKKGTCTVHDRNKNSWVVTLFVEQPDGSTANVNEYLISQGYKYER